MVESTPDGKGIISTKNNTANIIKHAGVLLESFTNQIENDLKEFEELNTQNNNNNNNNNTKRHGLREDESSDSSSLGSLQQELQNVDEIYESEKSRIAASCRSLQQIKNQKDEEDDSKSSHHESNSPQPYEWKTNESSSDSENGMSTDDNANLDGNKANNNFSVYDKMEKEVAKLEQQSQKAVKAGDTEEAERLERLLKIKRRMLSCRKSALGLLKRLETTSTRRSVIQRQLIASHNAAESSSSLAQQEQPKSPPENTNGPIIILMDDITNAKKMPKTIGAPQTPTTQAMTPASRGSSSDSSRCRREQLDSTQNLKQLNPTTPNSPILVNEKSPFNSPHPAFKSSNITLTSDIPFLPPNHANHGPFDATPVNRSQPVNQTPSFRPPQPSEGSATLSTSDIPFLSSKRANYKQAHIITPNPVPQSPIERQPEPGSPSKRIERNRSVRRRPPSDVVVQGKPSSRYKAQRPAKYLFVGSFARENTTITTSSNLFREETNKSLSKLVDDDDDESEMDKGKESPVLKTHGKINEAAPATQLQPTGDKWQRSETLWMHQVTTKGLSKQPASPTKPLGLTEPVSSDEDLSCNELTTAEQTQLRVAMEKEEGNSKKDKNQQSVGLSDTTKLFAERNAKMEVDIETNVTNVDLKTDVDQAETEELKTEEAPNKKECHITRVEILWIIVILGCVVGTAVGFSIRNANETNEKWYTPPTSAPVAEEGDREPTLLPFIQLTRFPTVSLVPTFAPTGSIVGGNVAITARNISIVVGENLPGIITRVLPDGEEQLKALPLNVGPFMDVTVDLEKPHLCFALGKLNMNSVLKFGACTFRVQRNAVLQIASCVVIDHLAADPFTRISAKDGNFIVSGGTDGFSVFSYDQKDGNIIMDTHYKVALDNVLSHPTALMINSSFVALGTEFADHIIGESRFGTMMVDLTIPRNLHNFRVQNSIGHRYSIAPSNFGMQSVLFTSKFSSTIFMYTANGALTVQEATRTGNTIEIVLDGFTAVMAAVNQNKSVLALGGVDVSGNFLIVFYNIGQPFYPEKYYEEFIGGRLTSMATYGNFVLYSTATSDNIYYDFFAFPEIPLPGAPTEAPTVSIAPSISPTVMVPNSSNLIPVKAICGILPSLITFLYLLAM